MLTALLKSAANPYSRLVSGVRINTPLCSIHSAFIKYAFLPTMLSLNEVKIKISGLQRDCQ